MTLGRGGTACGSLGCMDELGQQALADYMPREQDWDGDGVSPAQPSNAKLRMAARQASWLQAYATAGTITGASAASGISRDQYYYWVARDTLAFSRRLQLAQAAWVDHLEAIAYARIMEPSFNGRIGSDGLLSHALNAHSPRWRGPQPIAQAEVGEVMKAILSMARSAPKVVEGSQDAPALPEGGG
jgi:hypothetical protein